MKHDGDTSEYQSANTLARTNGDMDKQYFSLFPSLFKQTPIDQHTCHNQIHQIEHLTRIHQPDFFL